MNKFDKFVCSYAETHSIDNTITMLRAHVSYIQYCKYGHCIKTIKQDDNKISHLTAMIHFLTIMRKDNEYCKNFKEVYFND